MEGYGEEPGFWRAAAGCYPYPIPNHLVHELEALGLTNRPLSACLSL